MKFQNIEFFRSEAKASKVPGDRLPQVAVAGRSNVGKSSLLNWLFGRNLAKVAKAPGKTRLLNFFTIDRKAYLVDLPGYGYAKVPKRLQVQWGQELTRYLTGETSLVGVITLIDIRHPPTRLDLELQELLKSAEVPRLVVLTKADKISRSARHRACAAVKKELGLPDLPLAVSVKSGDGKAELISQITAILRDQDNDRP